LEAATFKPPASLSRCDGEWTVDLARNPEGVKEYGEPAGEGDDDRVVLSRPAL
jgi:hypothetical protein